MSKCECPNFDARSPDALGRRPGPCFAAHNISGAINGRMRAVRLIIYYLVFMIAGDLCAYVIGLVSERMFGSQVSLIVFLSLYFLFLWISWLLAVWITEPKPAEVVQVAPARQ
jgi:hypothetical protein